MHRGYIRMMDAGCGSGFPQETETGSGVANELRIDNLQSDWAPEVGIDGFVGYSHAAMAKLQRLSVLISKNLVVFKAELGRGGQARITLGFENSAQGQTGQDSL